MMENALMKWISKTIDPAHYVIVLYGYSMWETISCRLRAPHCNVHKNKCGRFRKPALCPFNPEVVHGDLRDGTLQKEEPGGKELTTEKNSRRLSDTAEKNQKLEKWDSDSFNKKLLRLPWVISLINNRHFLKKISLGEKKSEEEFAKRWRRRWLVSVLSKHKISRLPMHHHCLEISPVKRKEMGRSENYSASVVQKLIIVGSSI